MRPNEKLPAHTPETEADTIVVELIAPDGLGFGEGGISIQEQLKEGIITPSSRRVIHEHLTENQEAFKPVEVPDDGCGDGRPWRKIVQWITVQGKKVPKFFEKSKLRAKVFGGGLVVATSMHRILRGVPSESETIDSDREYMAEKLQAIEFAHGAHTDSHNSAHDDNCGCGAIDKYPEITTNIIKYRNEINGVLRMLYGDDFSENEEVIEQAFGTYADIVRSESYFMGTSGKKSMGQILDSGAVVKELAGHHIEETIVLNDVYGTTLDQQFFTETVKNKSEERPEVIQAFSVDIWRGKEIARAVALIAHQEDESVDIDEAYKLAYADFLIRTLGVAATLTDGSLPVYLRRSR